MITPGVSKNYLLDVIRQLGDADCHLALVGNDADYDCNSITFDGRGEVRGQGYRPGGAKLQGFACGLEDGVAWASWNTLEWHNASIRASGAVIYERANGNRIVTVLSLGGEQVSSQGLFRVRMPPPGAQNAVFWLS